MREEFVLIATARRLRAAGLLWQPDPGDRCALLDGVHLATEHAGLWLVLDADPQVGWVTIRDNGGRWPPARIAAHEALWLPTLGQLKLWLRALGYQISTIEGAASAPSAPQWATPFLGGLAMPAESGIRCTLMHASLSTPITGSGVSEIEVVAEATIWALMRPQPHPY